MPRNLIALGMILIAVGLVWLFAEPVTAIRCG